MAATVPLAVFANSNGLPIKQTGAAVDGGQNCSSCHNSFGAANSDPRGGITIEAANYKPNVPQIVRITVQYPNAARWGFQLTARAVNDETRMAGFFTPTDEVRVLCDSTGTVDCGGAVQFATHTSASSLTGFINSARTFDVQWTPPASEVGKVVLYAAGVAANNDNLPTGDRVYTTSVTLTNAGTCAYLARPTLGSVFDAASFRPTLAPNGLFSIKGLNFTLPGLTRQVGISDLDGNKFPTALGCVAVEVAGQRVPITYVQNDQINAQVPANVTGPVDVRVILNPGAGSEIRGDLASGIPVQTYAPAFFQSLDGKTIAARNPDFTISADPTVVPGARPVKPGDIILLYGTGFGPTTQPLQAGEILDSRTPDPLKDPVTVIIGGVTLQPSDILYAGATPGSIGGLYQLNVRVPASTPDGNIPVIARIGGVETQPGATIAVKH
jgi:uncharacterized protein (TIGR03437 family)